MKWTITYRTVFNDHTESKTRSCTIRADTIREALAEADRTYLFTEMSFPGVMGHRVLSCTLAS